MTRRKPTDKEFKNFWSVFEAEQVRKKQQLQEIKEQEDQHGETKA